MAAVVVHARSAIAAVGIRIVSVTGARTIYDGAKSLRIRPSFFGRRMTPATGMGAPLREEEAVRELGPFRARLTLAPGVSTAPRTDQETSQDDESIDSVVSRAALNRRLLALGDVSAASVALVVLLNVFGERRIAALAFAGMVLLLFLFKVSGLYDRDDLRLVHSTLDEVPLLLQLTGLFALGLAILQSIVLAGSLSATRIAALWIASFGTIVSGRIATRALAGRTSPPERCLVIGDAAQAGRIHDKLGSSHARAEVVASLPLASKDVTAADWADVPRIMRRVVSELDVHRIIIAPTTTDTRHVVDMIRVAKSIGVGVSVLPRMFEVVGSAVEFDDIDGMTMLGIRRFGLSRSSRLLKRTFDLAVGSLVLLILSPLFLAVALAIFVDSRGSIFFRQVRVGRDGKHFHILKFRSMVAGADGRKDELRSINEAGDGLFKIANDPRVTRVGRILRATSLDELPQLLNVLRGEMSLVGPRPLVVDEDAQVIGLDRSRLHLTPGMTGPWQVLGTRVPMQEMVAIDYLYVASWSMWLDLKLLLRTARHVARAANL
jgi:exopolysaccharide biosynthesis polyprenyl glycosylphosphotransferase